MMLKKLNINHFSGLFAIIVGAFAIMEAVRLYPTRTSFMIGDHSMPALAGSLMMMAGLAMVFLRFKPFKFDLPEKSMRNKMIMILALMFLYVFLIKIVGYTISTFLIAIPLFRIFGSYKWIKCVALSAALTACIYLVFIYFMEMPFPSGLIFGD